MMQDQKSLRLHWRTYLGGGSDIVRSTFAYSGGRDRDHGLTRIA